MQDDNIEGFTLDSSLIDDDSPLIEEYLTNFSSNTVTSMEDYSPPMLSRSLNNSFHKQPTSQNTTIVTATTLPRSNTTSTIPTSPKRVPSLREKLQVLLDKANNDKKKNDNQSDEEASAVVINSPSSASPTTEMKDPLISLASHSNQQQQKPSAAYIEGNNIERDNFMRAEQVEETTMDQTHQKPLENNNRSKTINIDINQQKQSIQKELATSAAAKKAANLPPKSKPELNVASEKLKKMDGEHYHFEEYKINEESLYNDDEEEEHQEQHTNDNNHNRDEDEDFHNQLTADISLIEEDKHNNHPQYNSFTVEEEKLELSDEEEVLTGRRAMEDLTVSKLEASTSSVDHSLTLSSLNTPVRTSSPPNQRARPSSSMRSSTPSYMNSTRASSSKEVSRTSVDLRASATDMRMKFGMINYQQRPQSANRSPSPNVLQKRRVTPRKERIYNIVPPLHFEDISVTTGLGVSI